MKLTVVTFKWRPETGPPKFASEHVNVLARMVRRNYHHPHRFVCITDDPAGLEHPVEAVELWGDHAQLRNPHGPAYPSCYRRLKLFSPEMAELLGERFVCLDLDVVVTGDLTPLWHRPEDFVILRGTSPGNHYNGGMMLMTAGVRAQVWSDFDPRRSPILALRRRQFGSDQGWIGCKLGAGEATWGKAEGVYSWVPHLKRGARDLPDNARLVMFNGKRDNPWDADPQQQRWVREHWR